MLVSIIQIVHPGTNVENFHKSLKSVLNQTYSNWEYLIIGEGGEDRILELNSFKDERIKFVEASKLVDSDSGFQKEFHKDSVIPRVVKKNLGAKTAGGEIIYFIDDDFILEPQILEQAVNLINTTNVTMVAVHNSSDPTVSIWSKVRNFERDMYKNDTGNISCRLTVKKLFDKVGGFNKKLVNAEDYDVHNRMLEAGGVIGFIEAKELHVGEPRTIWEIITKHYYYGKTMSEFKKSGGVLTLSNASPIRAGYIKNWKEFVKHPILAILFIYYQIVRFTAGAIGGYKIIPWIISNSIISIFKPKK